MSARALALLVSPLLLLSACGGSEPTQPDPAAESRKSEAMGGPLPSECKAVPAALGRQIASKGDGVSWVEGRAVRSAEHERVFYIAGKLSVGPDEIVGVWATNDLLPGRASSILAVDGFASQFTSWPSGDLSVTDDGAEKAKGCLNE